MSTFALLLMLALGIDHSGTLVSSEKGGGHDLSPNDSVSSATDGRRPSSGSGVEPPTSLPAPEPSTAVCQCQGHKRQSCFCLQNGVTCKCNASTGSVWALNEQGRATHKTGAYADPRAPRQTASTGYAVSLRTDGRWWWHDGGQWHNTSDKPREGVTYNGPHGAFVYRGGRMVPEAAKMAVEIKPTGHWERRCFGGYCRMVWVTD